jgi:hypothetical protein
MESLIKISKAGGRRHNEDDGRPAGMRLFRRREFVNRPGEEKAEAQKL